MSLKEIAARVGVSASTVSRVLNRKPGGASPQVEEKIWAAARALRYEPNPSARALRAGGAGESARPRVAVALSRIHDLADDPFFSELTRALEAELLAQSCELTGVIRLEDDKAIEAEPFDALIVLGRCSQARLTRLKARGDNIVGIWRNPLDFEVDEVVCDGKKAATLAAEYLLKLGHRRVAYIGDCSYESRYVGYCETLIRHDLPMDYGLILPTDQTERAGYDAMRKLLEKGGATAVLCANDITAAGALAAIGEARGARVAVISIDNIERAGQTRPMLTTVDVPRGDMAHMAVKVLLDRLQNGHKTRIRVEFPCRIVVRDSCFAVK